MFEQGVEWLRSAVPSPAVLSPAALVDLLAEMQSLESVLVERKLAVVAELTEKRLAACATADEWVTTGMDIAETEIGAALTVARSHAAKLMSLAATLQHRLPGVRAAMARGELDYYRAGLIDSATRNVTDELIGVVEEQALAKILAPTTPGGTGLTGRRLSNAISRIVGKVDPAGVRERRVRASRERYLAISPAEDAMMKVFGSLPAEHARNFDSRLRELANTVCPHDQRTFEQRKADALSALVDGLDHLPCACAREDCAQGARSGPVARKPLVHLIMLDSTLNGRDEEPAYLDGYGLIDAEHARDVAADADLSAVRIPEGVRPTTQPERAAAAGPPDSAYTYRPGAVLDAWVRILGGTCQWLHCDAAAWNSDLDHDDSFNHRDPAAGGLTTAGTIKPYCRFHHRVKHSGLWQECHNSDRSIDYLSPTGHVYQAPPTGYLNLLGRSTDEVVDPGPTGRERRSRVENRAASIRAERRNQQVRIELKRMGRTPYRARTQVASSEDDEPCPF